ncbi:hypothetical protein OQA88_7254 [Cercophora sp. LCS_1]
MKFTAGLYLLAAGLVSGRAVASSPDGAAILAGEHFRMALLAPRQATPTNLQVFSGSIGGVRASAITNTGDPDRPFGVDGDTFNDFETAAIRACDNQFNKCADIANNGQASFSVGDCDRQNIQCKATGEQAPTRAFAPAAPPVLVSSTAEFDIFCDA